MQTQAIISATGELTVRLPESFPPGTPVMVFMVMATPPAPRKMGQPFKWGRYPIGLVDNTFTFRREDIYAKDHS